MNTHILRVFSERSFLYLWIGEVFTQVATNLFNFFLILIVFKLTQSNTAVSFVVLSFTVPAIFFGSIAGVYVDRWNKKHVLIITNIIRALLLVLLAFSLNNIIMMILICGMVLPRSENMCGGNDQMCKCAGNETFVATPQ